jgi:hypothetical protein
MARVTYHVVEHDGGWAYKLGDVFSEAFATHDLALKAAQQAAREQQIGGETTTILYQDANGKWHEERSDGSDRPQAEVEDDSSS